MNKEKYTKYFFIVSLVILIYLSFVIIRPFLVSILTAIILTYITYPIYKKINSKIKNKNISSIIMIILILLIILIPLVLTTNALLKESVSFYNYIKDSGIPTIVKFSNQMQGYTKIDLAPYLSDSIKNIANFLIQAASKFLLSLPERVLGIFIILFTMFYLFKEGNSLVSKIKELIPLSKKLKHKLLKEFENITHAVVYGTVLTAIVQGIVATIGFILFGVPNPFLWGLLTTILAILPIIGPPFVYVPASIYLVAKGNLAFGIILLLYGLFIISSVDNLIRPKIIGKRAKVHPVIILIGLIGGIKIFGLIGIIVGPLILSFLITFFKLYKGVKHEVKS